MIQRFFIFFILMTFSPVAFAEIPEHFYNPPENINPDPDYVPGDYALASTYQAETLYYAKKNEMAAPRIENSADYLSSLGLGEVTFESSKNESASVLGYFREYFAIAKLGDYGPTEVTMVINMNSLDTAVPGRNHRILDIFFQSLKPKLGFAVVKFDRLEYDENEFAEMEEGERYPVKAKGTLTLNGVTKEISAVLNVYGKNYMWGVETAEPITLLLSDFNFGNRIYDLMKECNHQSIGNRVDVKVELYFA